MNLRFVLSILIAFFFIQVQAQCNLQETLTICDMTQIDYDNDGDLDGIINLYEEYNALPGVTPIPEGTGNWFDPGYNYALEEATGLLHVWDLSESSTDTDTYQFQLLDATSGCPDGLLVTLTLVLGPFSGYAVPTIGDNDVNVEVCDMGIDPCDSSSHFDLYQALLSTPSPHINGVWHYEGSNPYFIGIEGNRYLIVDIPYQPGPPLVDEAVFELTYTVPGLTPCDAAVTTQIKVSVIRAVFSGAANELNICESEILAGDFDSIDLRDDAYLINEDIEGIWLADEDPTGQITGPADSIISLSEVYADLIAGNPRFGCASYEYIYHVQSRSAVCSSSDSHVIFRFFEEIKPFEQEEPEEFCLTHINESTVNLYDYLTFTTENGVYYDYPNNSCTNWQFVSGPSDLGLVSNTGGLCDLEDDPNYTALGTVNLTGLTDLDVGTYIFRYTVLPQYTCSSNLMYPELINQPPFGCAPQYNSQAPCDAKTALVTLIVHPFNYPGEDTENLEFCESETSVNLFALLETNGIDTIYLGPDSHWENDNTGETLENIFVFPEISEEQTFNFTYYITANNCLEESHLSFTVFEQLNAGEDATIGVCAEDSSFELFSVLGGNPDTNGIWLLPDGTTTSANELTLDPATADVGNYIYQVASNGVCDEDQATVSVTIYYPLNAGENVETTACLTDSQLDLSTLLDASADAGGTFIDVDNAGSLAGSVLYFSTLSAGVYHFDYEVQANPSCVTNTATITLNITETPIPIAANQTFCFSDATTIGDLVVTTDLDYTWYDTATSDASLYLGNLLQDGEDYFVAATSMDGCDSERVQITVTLTAPDVPTVQNQSFCFSDNATVADLFAGTTLTYNWYSSNTATEILTEDLLLENNETYYLAVTDMDGCISQRAPMQVNLTKPPPPTVADQTFCISDAATLEDILVNTDLTYYWYASDTDTVIMSATDPLEDDTSYFIAGTDADGCVSDRAEMMVSLIQFGLNCDNENPIDAVVSPNDDAIHDELDLYELPAVFPNFEIKIFNRYGTVVYKGDVNTALFNGTSNVATTIGNKLPAGVYFYIFNPNDSIMPAFQGDFYLSR